MSVWYGEKLKLETYKLWIYWFRFWIHIDHFFLFLFLVYPHDMGLFTLALETPIFLYWKNNCRQGVDKSNVRTFLIV